MSETSLESYKITCQRCATNLVENPRLGVKLPASLKAHCERRASESGWKEGWVCKKCLTPERVHHRMLAAWWVVASLVLCIIFLAGSRYGSYKQVVGEEKLWEEFVETRVKSLDDEQRKALRWLARKWSVTGDEWRKEFPHVDACVLSGHSSVMDCHIQADRWTIKKENRRMVLKATEGLD